jgi:competence protein ComEA
MRSFKEQLFNITEALDIQIAERRTILILCALYIGIKSITFLAAEKESNALEQVLYSSVNPNTSTAFSPKDAMPTAIADSNENAQLIAVDSIVAITDNTIESTVVAAYPKKILATVYLNTATKEELVSLPGIGPAYADRILELRDEQGTFKHIDDLLIVKGIGPSRLEKLKPFIQIDPINEQ